MAVTVKPLNAAVGAEISGVDLARLNDAEFAQIEQAWNRHGALLFRDQHITDDDLLSFSRRFGELDPPPNQEHGRQSPEGYPDIYVVSNVLDDKGAPVFNQQLAGKLAAFGVPCFACSPDVFPDLMAATIERRNIIQWAAEQSIVVAR